MKKQIAKFESHTTTNAVLPINSRKVPVSRKQFKCANAFFVIQSTHSKP